MEGEAEGAAEGEESDGGEGGEVEQEADRILLRFQKSEHVQKASTFEI